MKYLKYYYTFNEATFSMESDLTPEEKGFLDMVKKEKPDEYNKYLTYVKNKRRKGLDYAKNKYEQSTPKYLREKERERKEQEKYSIKGKMKDNVRSLLPDKDTLTEIFTSKIGQSGSGAPYDELMKAVLLGSTKLNDLDLTLVSTNNNRINDKHVMDISGPYLDTKQALLTANNDMSFMFDNTSNGILMFLNNILEKDPDIKIDKISKIKPLYINDVSNPFANMRSEIRIDIHAKNCAVSTKINLGITIGSIFSKYDTTIFKTNKKAGNLKRGVKFDVPITKEDVLKSINDAFDMVNKELIEKKNKAVYNMKNFVNNLLKIVSESHEILAMAKNYPIVFNKIRNLSDDSNIKTAIDMHDMGFSD